jgi:O-methyltransferase
MRANFIHIEPFLRSVLDSGIQGDIAEFGVWHGTTFMPMAELARINNRTIHAVDSFAGMAQETARDDGRYLKGSLNVGGSAVFRELTKPFKNVQIHQGYIPEILSELDSIRFAFVHLDVDQYQPTLDSLRFLWPRMNKGGVLICHDWFADSKVLAAGAILDWMKDNNIDLTGELPSNHCWFIK